MRGAAIYNNKVHSTSKIESGSHVVNTIIQKYSLWGFDCDIINCNIGSFVSIANNVIIGSGVHPLDWISASPVFL
jgi:acetyltransferase-like isoleucine patch superfamily enzyme